MDDKMNKKGQVAMFIIIGVLVIGIIVLFFIFKDEIIPNGGGGKEITPDSFLKSCTEEKIRETVGIISLQGGNMNPVFYKRFKFLEEGYFVNISYLCYNQNYYLPCINQEPMLINHLEDEIKNEIRTEMEYCFEELGNSLENEGYVVDAIYNGFEVELKPKKIVVEINGELTLTKTNESFRYENFTITVPSRIYELAIVAQEITSQEAKYCNFEVLGFMLFYPEFHIDKFLTTDSITIYTIKHQDSEDKFRFAIRGCVIPPL